MDNPGSFSLGNFQLGAPQTIVGAEVDGLSGMRGLALSARLQLGSGEPAATILAYVQTSLDQGQTWFDLAAFAFTSAAGGQQLAQLVPSPAAPFAPASASLAAGTIAPGAPLGDRVRALVVSAGGNFTSSTLLSLWGCAR